MRSALQHQKRRQHRQKCDSRDLRRQLADVEAELARLSNEEADYDSLLARRNRLAQRLAQPLPDGPTFSENRRRQLEQRSAELQQRQYAVWVAMRSATNRSEGRACSRITNASKLFRSVPELNQPCQELEALFRLTPFYIKTP